MRVPGNFGAISADMVLIEGQDVCRSPSLRLESVSLPRNRLASSSRVSLPRTLSFRVLHNPQKNTRCASIAAHCLSPASYDDDFTVSIGNRADS